MVSNINVSRSMYDMIFIMIQLQRMIWTADAERGLQCVIEGFRRGQFEILVK